jgi:hypothetical protein
MSYYKPKFPKAKLHEVVTRYIANMRQLEREPNCDVLFKDTGPLPAEGRDTRGWLLRDPQHGSGGLRCVLLNDGDVWREVEGAEGTPTAGQRTWLNAPDDDTVMLLNRSLANARMGGDGFLEPSEQVSLHVVDDRRGSGADEPYGGPERRTRG